MHRGNNIEQIQFKILLIGASGVGKSSLLLKYVKGNFTYNYTVTTGVEYMSKNVKINDKLQLKLQIWDTAGQQAFKSVVRSFYKGVAAILLSYSIDRHQSFEQLSIWLKQIRQHSHEETLIVVVGLKSDLEQLREVQAEEGMNYMKSIGGAMFFELSAKTGQNIKQMFDKLAKMLHRKYSTSAAFRELVRPISVNSSVTPKSPSFNLSRFNRYEDNGNENCPNRHSCC